jgi:AcrR family transcriptional regulator
MTATGRRMSADARREQLLDVARDIAISDGFGAVSIDRVAKTAGVTRTLVYHQFGDLPGLIAALIDRESAIAVAGMSSVDWPVSGKRDDADQVSRGVLAYLHAAPVSWRLVLNPPADGPPELLDRIERGRSYARQIAARHVSRMAGRKVDPDGPTTRVLLTAMEETARLHLSDPVCYPDHIVLQHVRSLLAWAAGLATSRIRPPRAGV